MAHRRTGNTPMVRPCLVTLRDSLWKMQRSFDSLCSLPSTALRAGRMTMDSAALTTGPGQMLREIPHPCKNRKDGAPD